MKKNKLKISKKDKTDIVKLMNQLMNYTEKVNNGEITDITSLIRKYVYTQDVFDTLHGFVEVLDKNLRTIQNKQVYDEAQQFIIMAKSYIANLLAYIYFLQDKAKFSYMLKKNLDDNLKNIYAIKVMVEQMIQIGKTDSTSLDYIKNRLKNIGLSFLYSQFYFKKPDTYEDCSVYKSIHRSLKYFILKNYKINFIGNDDINISIQKWKLIQIFINLIQNAVDATQTIAHPEITFKINAKQKIVSIKDNGEGVSNILLCFEEFYTTKDKIGIGLTQCRTFLEEINSKIYINQNYKKGAEFIIKFGNQEKNNGKDA